MNASRRDNQGLADFRVLIIDDNEPDRVVMTMHLHDAWSFVHGLKVEYAADIEEALMKLESARFALAILNWNLPSGTGAQVLPTIRELGIRIPIVVLSVDDREAIAYPMESLGVAFIRKEFVNGDTLRAAIAESLRMLGWLKSVDLDDDHEWTHEPPRPQYHLAAVGWHQEPTPVG